MRKLWTMEHGINRDWFALIQISDDGIATVLREGRLHKFDDSQGSSIIERYHNASGLNYYHIAEEPVEFGQTRMAHGVHVNGQFYPFNSPVPRWGSWPNLSPEPEQ